MIKQIKILCCFITILFCLNVVSAFAGSTVEYCPQPNQLQLNQAVFGPKAKGGGGVWVVVRRSSKPGVKPQVVWQTYGGMSFATKIKDFIGVQWQGVEVGQVICLYAGEDSAGNLTPFPIALQQVNPAKIALPPAAQWIRAEHGYRKCTANKVTDCPFSRTMVQKPGIDIYKLLLKFRLGS